jgi:hypothetical protein
MQMNFRSPRDVVDLAERDSGHRDRGGVAEPDPQIKRPLLHSPNPDRGIQERIHPHGPPTSR